MGDATRARDAQQITFERAIGEVDPIVVKAGLASDDFDNGCLDRVVASSSRHRLTDGPHVRRGLVGDRLDNDAARAN